MSTPSKRKSEDITNSDSPSKDASNFDSAPKKRNYQKYSLQFKIKVIKEAKSNNNNRLTARTYDLDESLLRDWRKNEAKILKNLDSCTNQQVQSPFRVKGGGRKVRDEDLEIEVYDWIISLRAQHLRVTRKAIQQKALFIAGPETDFKASRGWLEKFMKRYDLSLRRQTHISQRLPKDVEDRITNFFIFLRKYFANYGITEANIVASDQTPIWFDNCGSSTIEVEGSKSVSLKSTGHEKMNFTVMLSACADGSKKRLFIVFKGKGNTVEAKKLKQRKDIHVTFSDNGWFNDQVTIEYLDFLYPNTLFQKQQNRLLIWDAYRCHISESTKGVLHKKNVHTMVIPGGCTSLIQAPDVSWNAPLKAAMRDEYDNWWLNADKEYTRFNNIKAPRKEVVVNMVKISLKPVSQHAVKH